MHIRTTAGAWHAIALFALAFHCAANARDIGASLRAAPARHFSDPGVPPAGALPIVLKGTILAQDASFGAALISRAGAPATMVFRGRPAAVGWTLKDVAQGYVVLADARGVERTIGLDGTAGSILPAAVPSPAALPAPSPVTQEMIDRAHQEFLLPARD